MIVISNATNRSTLSPLPRLPSLGAEAEHDTFGADFRYRHPALDRDVEPSRSITEMERDVEDRRLRRLRLADSQVRFRRRRRPSRKVGAPVYPVGLPQSTKWIERYLKLHRKAQRSSNCLPAAANRIRSSRFRSGSLRSRAGRSSPRARPSSSPGPGANSERMRLPEKSSSIQFGRILGRGASPVSGQVGRNRQIRPSMAPVSPSHANRRIWLS